MAAGERPWFVVRPGTEHRGSLIKLSLMYIGMRSLTRAEMVGTGEHVVGIRIHDDRDFDWVNELGDLESGDEFLITILTDNTPAVTVKLDCWPMGATTGSCGLKAWDPAVHSRSLSA